MRLAGMCVFLGDPFEGPIGQPDLGSPKTGWFSDSWIEPE